MEARTLIDKIQVSIFKILYRAEKLKNKYTELYKNIYKFSDIITQLLFDPEIESDNQFLQEIKKRKYLTDENGEIEYDKNGEFSQIENVIIEYLQENNDDELKKLQEDFNQLTRLYNSTFGSKNSRFEAQKLERDDIARESTVSFIKNKSEQSAITVTDLEKIDGGASKNYVIKGIDKPGIVKILNDGTRRIVVGKKEKDPLESRHFNIWLRKEEKNETTINKKDIKSFTSRAIYSDPNMLNSLLNEEDLRIRLSVNNHDLYEENEMLNSSLIYIIDESSYYKIRRIHNAEKKIQIKNIKDTTNLHAFLYKTNSIKSSSSDIKIRIANFSKIELKEYTHAFLIAYLIGLIDRTNEGNILYDQSRGKFYNIDLTDRAGIIHQKRIASAAECIKNKDLILFREKFIEFFFEEAYFKAKLYLQKKGNNKDSFGDKGIDYKAMDFTKEEKEYLIQSSNYPIITILNRCLNELSDNELLDMIRDFTTDIKVQQIKEVYDEYLNNFGDKQLDRIEKDIFYNPSVGMRAINNAIKEIELKANQNTKKLPWYTKLSRFIFSRKTEISPEVSERTNNNSKQSNANIDSMPINVENKQTIQIKSGKDRNFIITSITSLFASCFKRGNNSE